MFSMYKRETRIKHFIVAGVWAIFYLIWWCGMLERLLPVMTACIRGILAILIAAQLAEEFSTFRETGILIIMFTKHRHFSVPWAKWTHFISSQYIFLRPILILFPQLLCHFFTSGFWIGVFISFTWVLPGLPRVLSRFDN